MGGCCSADGSVSREEEFQPDTSCAAQHDKLQKLLRSRPFLEKEHHTLNQYVKECKECMAAGDPSGAENALVTLDLETDAEEHTIAAAFQKFDHSGDGVLQGEEIKFMLDYLGFPCTDKDVKDLMETVDTDSDQTVSFDEFIVYVGAIGGSGKLFELRRKQIEDRLNNGGVGSRSFDTDKKDILKTELASVGITEDVFAYWQLTAASTELEEAANLKPCQRKAVRHIRNLAKESHNKAMPSLKQRVAKLGYTEVDLHMALAWVRELAPMIIHIKLDKLGDLFAGDTHYRNQFETNTSSGLLKTSARIRWERGLFGTAYEPSQTEAFDRPKYGVQNIWNDHRGVVGCAQYGDSYLVLKDVRLRCTMSPEDSANLPAKRLAVPDYYAHVFNEYSDKELKETLRVAKGGDEKLGDSKAVIEKWGKYKEVQIHGEIDFKKHIERVVVHERHKKDKKWVDKIAEAHGWKVTWMGEMKDELKGRSTGRAMDQDTWQQKLQYLRAEQETAQKALEFVKQHEVGSVQWSFEIRDGWQPFDKICQEPMEEAYQKFKAGGDCYADIKWRERTIMIDFETMTQTVKGGAGRSRKLQRVEV